jgi:hypothetical protein
VNLENAFVRVTKGKTAQGNIVENTVFKLIQHIKKDVNNRETYITVDGKGHENIRQGNARIYLKSTDFEMMGGATKPNAPVTPDVFVPNENMDTRSDEEIAAELVETFEIVAEMTEATATGVVKGLVISGPAGIGKSHTVETTLTDTFGAMADATEFDIIKGKLTPIMLYCALYHHRDPGSVLVFDDADGILYEEDSLNILKAVLDTKKTRRVCWGSSSLVLEKEGVPTSFDFHGGVIFLTNLKWDKTRSERIANHLQAIMSRVHYIDVQIDTMRERIILIKNTALNTNMLDEYNFSKADIHEILDYMMDNIDNLQNVDLRTVVKCADMKLAMPQNWTKLANRSLCKNYKKGY